MRKLLLGTLAVTALSLPISAFTTDLASAKEPYGFSQGEKEGWKKGSGSHKVPPGWQPGHGEKEGWGSSKKPPGLR
jgi:hypothetical protein